MLIYLKLPEIYLSYSSGVKTLILYPVGRNRLPHLILHFFELNKGISTTLNMTV